MCRTHPCGKVTGAVIIFYLSSGTIACSTQTAWLSLRAENNVQTSVNFRSKGPVKWIHEKTLWPGFATTASFWSAPCFTTLQCKPCPYCGKLWMHRFEPTNILFFTFSFSLVYNVQPLLFLCFFLFSFLCMLKFVHVKYIWVHNVFSLFMNSFLFCLPRIFMGKPSHSYSNVLHLAWWSAP